MVETLSGEAGYALLDVTEVVPASPAPLAQIADQVRRDLVQKRSADRANAAASQILAATARGASLGEAIRSAGIQGASPAEPIDLRRGQLAQFAQGGQEVPPPLRILFSLAPGKAQRAAGPSGIYLVRLNRITPGNASLDPTLIARETTALSRAASEEVALQWLSAAQKELGVTRNEDAIRAARQRIFSGS